MEADWTRQLGWTSPRVLSTAGTWLAAGPALAMNARGDAVVAWTEAATIGDALPRLRARFRPAGGEWGRPGRFRLLVNASTTFGSGLTGEGAHCLAGSRLPVRGRRCRRGSNSRAAMSAGASGRSHGRSRCPAASRFRFSSPSTSAAKRSLSGRSHVETDFAATTVFGSRRGRREDAGQIRGANFHPCTTAIAAATGSWRSTTVARRSLAGTNMSRTTRFGSSSPCVTRINTSCRHRRSATTRTSATPWRSRAMMRRSRSGRATDVVCTRQPHLREAAPSHRRRHSRPGSRWRPTRRWRSTRMATH